MGFLGERFSTFKPNRDSSELQSRLQKIADGSNPTIMDKVLFLDSQAKIAATHEEVIGIYKTPDNELVRLVKENAAKQLASTKFPR